MASQRIRLPGLDASHFQHEWDLQATALLKRAQGMELIVAKLMEYGLERYYAVENIASNIEVSARQCPDIYAMLCEAAEILSVPVPKLYIDMNPFPNAYTYGHKRPFIVLHHSLIDMLTDEEIFFVIAHELGHIKCNHVLYMEVARSMHTILAIVGQATLGLGSLVGHGVGVLVLDWMRKAELSADRAALLATQDLEVGLRVLMKLAGGASPRLLRQLDPHEFVKQAGRYHSLDYDDLSRLYKFIQTAYADHPWPVLRAAELKLWYDSGAYHEILTRLGESGDADERQRSALPSGIVTTAPASSDRQALSPSNGSTPQTCCPECGAPLRGALRFCTVCGRRLA